ncbi:hypothetical protein CMI37_27395 [Candidatus Pacearchaeota archaeon]|nr:hypothetical protein [Candidatus Pacearchaeota archaeon]
MRKNNVLLGAALVGGFLLLRPKPVKAEDKIKVGIFADHVIGESPLTVNFRLDTQGKRPLKFVKWLFGDGETSNVVNPTYTFKTDADTEVFHVDVTAIDANDASGSGRLNITVVKLVVGAPPSTIEALPLPPSEVEETTQNLLEKTQFAQTPTSITNSDAAEIMDTGGRLTDSEVISLALQNRIPVYEGGYTVSGLRSMLGIN